MRVVISNGLFLKGPVGIQFTLGVSRPGYPTSRSCVFFFQVLWFSCFIWVMRHKPYPWHQRVMMKAMWDWVWVIIVLVSFRSSLSFSRGGLQGWAVGVTCKDGQQRRFRMSAPSRLTLYLPALLFPRELHSPAIQAKLPLLSLRAANLQHLSKKVKWSGLLAREENIFIIPNEHNCQDQWLLERVVSITFSWKVCSSDVTVKIGFPQIMKLPWELLSSLLNVIDFCMSNWQ